MKHLCPHCKTKIMSIDKAGGTVVECGDHEYIISPRMIVSECSKASRDYLYCARK